MMLLAPRRCRIVLMVGFGVKLRIRQHHPREGASCRHIEQLRQRTRVTPGPWRLAAPTKSAAAHPPQSATSTKGDEAWSVHMLLQVPVEEGADGRAGLKPGAYNSEARNAGKDAGGTKQKRPG